MVTCRCYEGHPVHGHPRNYMTIAEVEERWPTAVVDLDVALSDRPEKCGPRFVLTQKNDLSAYRGGGSGSRHNDHEIWKYWNGVWHLIVAAGCDT